MKNNKRKQKSTLLRDAMALFLITLISGLALSYVYEITKVTIEQQKTEKKLKAYQDVFEEAVYFAEDKELMKLAKNTDLTTLNADYVGITIDEIHQAFDSNKEAIGYGITVTTTAGYKDPITIVIGYTKVGRVKGIEITSINETAGLGMLAAEPEFLGQYVDKNVKQFIVTNTGATSDELIDAISGATITSRAVTNAINAVTLFVSEYATNMGGGQDE